MRSAIYRAHVFVRLLIFEPYATEIEMYEMFLAMRDHLDRGLVKQWWNDNRRKIMKSAFFFFLHNDNFSDNF
jgi:hypothetical protein